VRDLLNQPHRIFRRSDASEVDCSHVRSHLWPSPNHAATLCYQAVSSAISWMCAERCRFSRREVRIGRLSEALASEKRLLIVKAVASDKEIAADAGYS